MGLLLDIYENFRKTNSSKKSNKSIPRKYDFDAGFTGERKKDYSSIKKDVGKRQKENNRLEDFDGR